MRTTSAVLVSIDTHIFANINFEPTDLGYGNKKYEQCLAVEQIHSSKFSVQTII